MNMSYVAVLFGVAALADAAHALNPTQTMGSATIKLFVATGESLELITGIRAICDPSTEGQYSNVPDHRQWGPA